MKTLTALAAWIICLSVAAPACAVSAEPLALYTLEWAPYAGQGREQGTVSGIAYDIVIEMMRRAGQDVSPVVVLPWARGLSTTNAKPNSCLFPVARVPEREHDYRWIGAIGQSDWVLFARREDHLNLKSIDDARPYRIGTIIKDLSVSYLTDHQLKPDIVSSDKQNVQKMLAHRIDLWSSGRLPGMLLLRQMGITDLEPALTFTTVDLYLACTPSMDDAVVERLNATLAKMYADGTIKKMYRQNGFGDEAPALHRDRK